MPTTQSSSGTTAQPRKILKGEQDANRPGVFLITLDGNEVVETDSREIAQTASRAMKSKRLLEIDLLAAATEGGHKRIAELRQVTIQQHTEAPAEPQAPATPAPKQTPKPAAPQALAKIPELPQGLIMRSDELARQMETLRRSCNMISPLIAMSEIAPGFGANLSIVEIDGTLTDEEYGRGPETYRSKKIHKSNERALNIVGLGKLAQGAGIQWDRIHSCKRIDDRKTQYRWEWEYAGGIRMPNGQWFPFGKSKELDLRDGSAAAAGMTPAQLQQARSFGSEICESKAMNRAIRAALSLKQTYTTEELKKPFLIVQFAFTPDMSDPEIKKMVTQQAMSGIGALYTPPAPPRALPAVPEELVPDVTDDDDDETAGDDPFAEPSPTVPGAAPGFTLPADAKFIGAIKALKTGKFTSGKNEGQTWTLWELTATSGETWTTFDHKIVAVAEDAKTKGWPVRVTEEENEKYPDQLVATDVTLIDPRQPNLPLEGD